MGRGSLLCEQEKDLILAFSKSGLNIKYREISREIGRSRKVITNFLKNPGEYGKKRSTGRKPVIDNRSKQCIVKKSSNSFVSCSRLVSLSARKVSKMTVWRMLNKCDHIVRAKGSWDKICRK